MSDPKLETMSPELQELLQAERMRPPPAADMQGRVLERLAGSVLDAAPVAAAGAVSAAATVAPHAGGFLLRRLPTALALLAVGGAGGAAMHAKLRPEPAAPPARVVHVMPPAGPSVPPLPELPAMPEPELAAPVEAPRETPRSAPARRVALAAAPAPAPPPAPALPAAPAVSADSQSQLERDRALAAERVLLEQARTALSRGQPQEAVRALREHRDRFRNGQLVEEREALTILALAAAGQLDSARARADWFRSTYPRSMLLRSIDATLVGSDR